MKRRPGEGLGIEKPPSAVSEFPTSAKRSNMVKLMSVKKTGYQECCLGCQEYERHESKLQRMHEWGKNA